MKFIFLDIDGVLNNSKTHDDRKSPVLLDARNMKNLQRIVQITDAKIVLVSSYKDSWVKFTYSGQGIIGRFLVMTFAKYGLSIFDKTESTELFAGRGVGVKKYIKEHETESFVIIDDSSSDYDKEGLIDYWVRPSGEKGGLTKELAKKAIGIISK
ncbi:MAG: hypothetical protein J5911_01700 [Clostridia bacterium]|nr:hypothetical protein [Clostridia bacterium]